MDFHVRMETTTDGDYVASCGDPDVRVVSRNGASTLELLRAEIRYRLEMCPCSSVDEDYVTLRVAED